MATSPPILNQSLVSRALPSPNSDGTSSSVSQRADRYGGMFITAPAVGKYPWAEEGSYFVARTPTPGTGVSHTVLTGFDATKAMIFGNNTSTTKSVWIDRIKLITTVAAASATTFQFAVKVDNSPIAITTNHVATAVPVCPNLGISATSSTAVWYQNSATATVLTALSGSAIVVAEGSIGGISIVGDEYHIEFGQALLGGNSGLTAAQATEPAVKTASCGPVVIPPGGGFAFYTWFAGNSITALSYSFELGVREC